MSNNKGFQTDGTKILGTNILNPVVPFDIADINATHIDVFGAGGFRTVENINDRDLIKSQRRKNLMLVAVESNSSSGTCGDGIGVEIYQLFLDNPDNILSDNNLDNNDNWIPVDFGGGADWVFPPPSTSTSPGKFGERSFDDSFMYICIEDNLWKRMAMDFFIFSGSTSGIGGTNFGLPNGVVPVWDNGDWNTTLVVKNIEDAGTSGVKVTYTDNSETFLEITGSGGDNWVLPPPVSSFSSGKSGARSYDGKFLYICTEDNLWKRVRLDFFLFDTGSTSGSGTNGIEIGSVPVWDGEKWDTKLTVCDLDIQSSTSGTSGGGLLVTYTNNSTKLLPIESGSGSSILGVPTDGGFGGTGLLGGQASGVDSGDRIEDAFDKMETLLEYLVPPKAPNLSDWTAFLNADVSGKISFDESNPIGGYVAADQSGIGIISPISVDGQWNIGSKRLGIHSDNNDIINGTLNEQVVADSNGAYSANTFGDATDGVINMYINSIMVDTIDLTSTSSSINSSNVSVSAISFSKFSNGNDFQNFVNRTGTWSMNISDINVTSGYNYVIIEHNTGTNNRILDRYEFIIDDDTTPISFSGESLHSLNMSGFTKLSGITYHTGGTAQYNLTLENMYRNTYYAGGDAITHTGGANSYGVLVSATQESLSNNSGNEAQIVTILNKIVTIANSGRRILNENITINTTAKRTVQGTSNTVIGQTINSINNILLDNYILSPSSTLTSESFDDEDKRLVSSLSYDTVSDIASGAWDSGQSLGDGTTAHNTGLQIIDGKLIYPGKNVSVPVDFRTSAIANAHPNNDGDIGGSGRDYSNLSGMRSYYRYFKDITKTTANFVINITGSGGTFVSKSTSLIGNNIHLEMKTPTQTGWMDCYEDFSAFQFADSDGARASNGGLGRSFGIPWGLTIGTQSTAFSDNSIVLRITTPNTFSGEISEISFIFS